MNFTEETLMLLDKSDDPSLGSEATELSIEQAKVMATLALAEKVGELTSLLEASMSEKEG